MSSYTGKCVVRLSTGQIHNVQVVDTAGNGMTLPPEEYVARRISPPLKELPDCSHAEERAP